MKLKFVVILVLFGLFTSLPVFASLSGELQPLGVFDRIAGQVGAPQWIGDPSLDRDPKGQDVALGQGNIGLLNNVIPLKELRKDDSRKLEPENLKRSHLLERSFGLTKGVESEHTPVDSTVGRAARLPSGEFPEPVEVSFGMRLASF